jgi:hypothetical protein
MSLVEEFRKKNLIIKKEYEVAKTHAMRVDNLKRKNPLVKQAFEEIEDFEIKKRDFLLNILGTWGTSAGKWKSKDKGIIYNIMSQDI